MSANKKLRTRTRYRIVGSDYSAQEPRMSCFLSSDEKMLEAYTHGKDLYAMIASSALGVKYEDCLEFWPEGTELEIDGKKVIAGKKTHLHKQGKENRNIGKKLNLAATYGMGGATAGANMGKTAKEGEELLENFFNDFTGLKAAIDGSKEFLRKNGYVEDFLGRRRRLPEINLPPYEFSLKIKKDELANFNPILMCKDRSIKDEKIIKWEKIFDEEINKNIDFQRKRYLEECEQRKLAGKKLKEFVPKRELSNKVYEKLSKEALADGVIVVANTARIAQAERQCFNARVQGSAASLSKLAMVDIYRDEELNRLKTKLIIPVHDELLVECPAYYSEQVEKRLPEVMISAALRGGDRVPQACDPYNVSRWYADVCAAYILDEFKKLEAGNEDKGILPLSKEEAINIVINNHSEFPREAIIKTIETGCDLEF